MKKKRGPGRPPIWKEPLKQLKWGQWLIADDRTQAMTIYVCARRLGFTVKVKKLSDGTYVCTKAKK